MKFFTIKQQFYNRVMENKIWKFSLSKSHPYRFEREKTDQKK